MQKSIPLIPLFEKFIADSYKGRRLKLNGERIKPQTIENYRYAMKILVDFSEEVKVELRVALITGRNKTDTKREADYWRKMYLKLSDYLIIKRKCHDNYVGGFFKCLKV